MTNQSQSRSEREQLLADIEEFLQPRDDGHYEKGWDCIRRMKQFLEAPVSEQQPITDNDKRWRIVEHGCKWVSLMPREGEGRCFYLDDVKDLEALRKFADGLSKRQIKMLKDAIKQTRPAERNGDA